MAARWGRLRGEALRSLSKVLETEEEAAARLEQERRAKAARLRRIQRLMEPPGPPERKLTRAAMEQMRYLRLESPEEWPVSRLARSFEVSPDVVARVLRSRFSPSLERAVKQDSRVQPRLSSALPAPQPSGSLVLLPSRAGAALPLAPEVVSRKRAGRGAPPPASSRQQGRSAAPADQDQDEDPSLRVVQRGQDQDEDPSLRVVQRGQEFVDGDGNFLYRIPA